MASSPTSEPELEAPVPQHWDETPGRRKMDRKIVVKVRTEENSEKQKTDSPPSDFWSWRKYGQKPIKGSPYPRGYFRCSTSKGCSAKKQVERCRTDASLLIITYTSNHNHPGPDLLHLFSTTEHVQKGDLPGEEPPTTTCEEDKSTGEEHPHPQSPPKCTEESSQLEEQDEEEKSNRRQDDIHFGEGGAHPVPKRSIEENNDFFDELEELPMSSSCTSIQTNFFDERVLLLPS